MADARCTGHPFDGQLNNFRGHAVASFLNGLDERCAVNRTCRMDFGPFGRQVDGDAAYSFDLGQRGFDMADVVRTHYYVTDRAFVQKVYPIFGEAFGEIRPAATLIVCELAEPEMKIEIEVTALRRSA